MDDDAFGQVLIRYLDGDDRALHHIVERDDGLVDCAATGLYFEDDRPWHRAEQAVLSHAHGRILDIGAGAGRFALQLAHLGHDVVALDVSDGCAEVCQKRGLETFHGTVFDYEGAGFDSFLLMGNNYGLLGSPQHAPLFLSRLASLANPGALVMGTGVGLATDDPLHLEYHAANRAAGKPPAQLSLRIRWRKLTGPWFDYWLQDPEDVARLAEEFGWEQVALYEGQPAYGLVLRFTG